ncbi:ribosomal RNA processing protein 36 homolog [Anopheles cruzii]|uniref:ribosomal RNA processing protein 36 homolog n=1 Tax=Anopheles cruzii TaxID=68878 RepID=UPI0022EC8FE6|nr:ribosomal RNA processing protein 36 homolog [Anopheles cruzii]
MDSSDDQSEHSHEESESSVEKGSSDSQDEEDDVPKLADDEFKEIPFEDLLKLQKKLGTRMYNEAIFGKTSDKPSQAEATKSSKKRKFEPGSSNSESDDDSGPEEVSARRKVPQLGKTKNRNYDEANQRPRDPRFDPQQGYFNGRKFREDYGFVNDMRTKELKKLQNRMQSTTDPEEGAKLKFLVQRTGNQIREYAKQRKLDETKRQEKQQARQAIKDGKRPFYERKSTKQARELVEQYDRLKQDGKLAKHIDKRRKKVSAKDRKKLDFST